MSYIVLMDCNNFFASCERVFNPRLEGRPILILSNNDGCVVSCSQEVKKLGVTIGQPFFQVKELCERCKVNVFSSNFQLYTDLSNRVMSIASNMAPEMEIYSIDEAFLQFPGELLVEDVFSQCLEIRRRIRKWVGIPISVGISRTKTLAKVATKLAKKEIAGVVDLTSRSVQEEVLKRFPLRDVWGIGSRIEAKLHSLGMQTAWDLREADLYRIRRTLGVVGERMVLELRGTPCLCMTRDERRKSITRSRSFGRAVDAMEEICEAVATHVSSACERLRSQNSYAKGICVYVMRTKERGDFDYQTLTTTTFFPRPVNETSAIIHAAKACIPQLFCQGKRYRKCGVTLIDLVDEEMIAPDLFEDIPPRPQELDLYPFYLNPNSSGRTGIESMKERNRKERKLSEVVDAINARFGKGTLSYGAMGVDSSWKMRCDHRSALYTTCVDELPIVKA